MFTEFAELYTDTPKTGWQRLLKITSKHAISRPSQRKTMVKLFCYLIYHKQDRVRKTRLHSASDEFLFETRVSSLRQALR